MCHGGVFERALVPEHSHTHTCAVRGLRALAPSQVCLSNGHGTNVSHPLRVVLLLSRVGCNNPSSIMVWNRNSSFGWNSVNGYSHHPEFVSQFS